MARLVLDTNSLLMCISRRSQYHDLWLSFLDGRNELCVTTEILNEYAEIFVDCAVASNAKYVVTEDSHFNILKEIDFPKVEIVDLDDIIKQIQ